VIETLGGEAYCMVSQRRVVARAITARYRAGWQELVEGGAAVDAQDLDGCTALMFAVWAGDREVVSLLLYWEADVGIRNNRGQTAWDCSGGSRDLRRLLLVGGWPTLALPDSCAPQWEACTLDSMDGGVHEHLWRSSKGLRCVVRVLPLVAACSAGEGSPSPIIGPGRPTPRGKRKRPWHQVPEGKYMNGRGWHLIK
jgi:hypothetical protein